MFNSTYFMTY